MADLITTSFRTTIANQFIDSVQENNNSYYVFAAQSVPWPNESSPPAPLESQNEVLFNIWDNMLFGKVISNSDVIIMTNLNLWTSNTVYPFYDDQDTNLLNKEFFVTVNANTSYDVFKCLNNNNGIPSTVSPSKTATTEADPFYFTSDGYQWKYLYSITSTVFNTFASNLYLPYIPNANTSGNAVPGSLTTILVTNPGSNYNSYANGFFQDITVGSNNLIFTIDPSSAANNGFYINNALKIVSGTGKGQLKNIIDYIVSGGTKNVVVDSPFNITPDFTSKYEISPLVSIAGSGNGALARAIINPSSNSIASIEISNTGADYNWATAIVTANTGLLNVVSNTFITADTAILRPIIGPALGHGGNIPYELGMHNVGIATTFANSESSTIPDASKFRTYGIIQAPLFANVQLVYANNSGNFSEGELIVQNNTDASGYITSIEVGSSLINLTNVNGTFYESNNLIVGTSSNTTALISDINNNNESKGFDTFDQRLRFSVSVVGGVFVQNEIIVENLLNSNAIINEANSSFIGAVQVRGIFNSNTTLIGSTSGAIANVQGILEGDLVINSGDIIYINNIQPVQRSSNTSETIQMIIGF